MELFGLEFAGVAIKWCACTLTVMLILAWREGTLLKSSYMRVNVPLLQHEGIFWGYIPMAVVNGLVFPHLNFASWKYKCFYCSAIFFCLLISYLAHRSWWPKTEEEFCPTMASWNCSNGKLYDWNKDMTLVGWFHFFVFAVQLVIYAGFLFTVMPKKVIVIVGIISAVQFSLGVAQPYLMVEFKRRIDSNPWLTASMQCAAITMSVSAVIFIKFFLVLAG